MAGRDYQVRKRNNVQSNDGNVQLNAGTTRCNGHVDTTNDVDGIEANI